MRARLLGIFLLLLIGGPSCVAPGRTEERSSAVWLYDSIQFEIATLSSLAAVDPLALERFRNKLHDNHICDRARVRFVLMSFDRETPQPAFWDNSTLAAFTTKNRTVLDERPKDRDLYAFVPYLWGPWYDYTEGLKFLGGIQYEPASFAIFKSGAGDREAGVLLHEFGHLIGLCDPKTHPTYDSKHRSHCSNEQCVMYWSAPSAEADFDPACKAYIEGLLRARGEE